ncbi:MAG: multidrug efflux SMR transporter [Bdellovibrio sp.]|nr:multidrug efflux SMR transporter [Bdellovibrio sp.]
MNPWILLFIGGALEVGFTTFMVLSEGFTKWFHVALFFVCAVGSFVFLSMAMKSIPLGTAYAVWTGVGALGTAAVGMIFFKDPITFSRVFFLLLLVFSIIGLKLVSADTN